MTGHGVVLEPCEYRPHVLKCCPLEPLAPSPLFQREANEVQYNGSQLFIFDPMLIMMQNRESSGSSGSSSGEATHYLSGTMTGRSGSFSQKILCCATIETRTMREHDNAAQSCPRGQQNKFSAPRRERSATLIYDSGAPDQHRCQVKMNQCIYSGGVAD